MDIGIRSRTQHSRASSLVFLLFALGLALTVTLRPPVASNALGSGEDGSPPTITEQQLTLKNPATVYCLDLGYEYRINESPDGGQSGVCLLPGNLVCSDWDFLNGKCGQEYSICGLNGLETVTLDDGNNPFSPEYAVCADARGNLLEPVVDMVDLQSKARGRALDGPFDRLGELQIPAIGPDAPDASLPSSFDWRNHNGGNWMTPVKNQGICGSCWSFSAVGVSEAVLNIGSYNPNLDLNMSEQYMVTNCSSAGACDGGYKGSALAEIVAYGVPDEGCLPYGDGWATGCTYTSSGCSAALCTYDTGGQCSDYQCSDRCGDWASRLVKTSSSTSMGYRPDIAEMKQALVEHGPLAVSMNMGGSFAGGIYVCADNVNTGHAVVIVGYSDAGGYWIVKNSWGGTWGADGDGYFKVAYDNCAIHKWPYYADAVQPVVINELDPGVNDWLEVYSAGSQPVTLNGWRLIVYDSEGAVDGEYVFPTFILQPGAYVTLHEWYGVDSGSDLYTNFGISWQSDGSGASALTDGSSGVDFVRFGDSSVAPPAGTGWSGTNPSGPPAGLTLGRNPTSTDTDAGSDWCAESATQGAQNVGCVTCYSLGASSSPGGSGSIDQSPEPNCGSQYVAGTGVQLTAQAFAGYTFDHWSGSASGTSNPTSITMDAAKSVTANFVLACYSLSTSVSPGSGGSVVASPLPNCGSQYTAGTEVQLTAQAAAGYAFDSWSGSVSGSDNPKTITMDEPKSVTASFDACHSLSTVVNPGGSGNVVASPLPNCGSQYIEGTEVQLTAQAAAGYVFDTWSGDASGSANPMTITMDGPKSVTADFAQECHSLSTGVSPGGSGNVSASPLPNCGAQYLDGTQVQLTAQAAAGYNFGYWSGGVSGSANPITITMDGPQSVTANFGQQCHSLSTGVSPSGGGSVIADPLPNCGDQYVQGTPVELTAQAAVGYAFGSWSGDASGGANPLTITMDAPRSVTANFQTCFSLTSVVSPGGSGSISADPPPGCGDLYVRGTEVELTAQAASGYVFDAWSGDAVGSSNPTTVSMDAAKSVTAAFESVVVPILLVDDDDNDPDVRTYYTSVLDLLGESYDVWDTHNSDDEPDAGTLAPYSAVIWFTGDEYDGYAGPGADGESALKAFLDGGKCLFISSQDYHYDRGLTAFMSTYLGADSVVDDVTQSTVSGQGSVFGGLGPYSLVYPFADWSDVITPDGTAELAFGGDQGGAAVNKDSGVYRTTFWSFPFEALPGASQRTEALGTFLSWCSLESDLSVGINEIDVGDPDWIEFYNAGSEAVDMTGWHLQTSLGTSLSDAYTFPGFSLGPGAYVVLHEGAGIDTPSDLYSGGNSLPWINSGSGAAALTSSSDRGIDFVRWGSAVADPPLGTDWTGANPATPPLGQTLGRGAASIDSDDGDDWCTQSPTMGAQNQGCGSCQLPGTPILVYPEPDSILHDSTPAFEWEAVDDADEYQIQVGNAPDWNSLQTDQTGAGTVYTPALGYQDGVYYWRVRGHNTGGACDVYGSWSLSRTVSIDTSFDVEANWVSGTVTVDGELAEDAWNSAAAYDISTASSRSQGRLTGEIQRQGLERRAAIPQVALSATVTLYVLNDDTHLYLAIDNPNDTTIDAGDQMGVYFDDNPLPPDGQWTNATCGNLNGEGNFWVITDTVTYREWISGPLPCDAIVPATGTVGMLGYGGGHAQAELSIDLASSALQASAADVLSMYLWIYDASSDRFDGKWQASSDYADPSTYGALTLAAGPGLSAPLLLSPTNEAWIQDATPLFAWEPVTGATGYRLQVDDDADLGSPEIDLTTDHTEYVPDLPLPLGTYSWRVQASNANESSPWSIDWRVAIATNRYLPQILKDYR